MLSLKKDQGGEETHRKARDRLLLIKAFTRAFLEYGASSAFASNPEDVPDVPGSSGQRLCVSPTLCPRPFVFVR